MAHKYLIDLTDEKQGYLHDVIRKGKTTARRVAHAHVLLRAATGATDEDIAQTLHLGTASVHRIRQRVVDEGLTAALSERSRLGSPPVLTGKQAAFLVALACSTPPAGRHRWTLKLLADRFVELRQIDMISPDWIAASRTSTPCGRRSPLGKAPATSAKPKSTGSSAPTWPGPNSSASILPWNRPKIRPS